MCNSKFHFKSHSKEASQRQSKKTWEEDVEQQQEVAARDPFALMAMLKCHRIIITQTLGSLKPCQSSRARAYCYTSAIIIPAPFGIVCVLTVIRAAARW